jgi:glycosyltransferase 2 family protein
MEEKEPFADLLPDIPSEPPEPPSTSSLIQSTWIAIGVGVAVFMAIFWVVPDKGRVLHTLKEADGRLLLFTLFLHITALMGDAARLWFLLGGVGVKVPFGRVVKGIMASNFVSLVTPVVTSGAPVIIWVLHMSGANVARVTAATVVGGIVAQSTLAVLALALPLIAGVHNAGDPFAKLLWLGVRVVVPAYMGGVLLIAFASYRIDIAESLLSAWRLRIANRTERFYVWLHKFLQSASDGLQTYRAAFILLFTGKPVVLFQAYLGSLVYFIGLFSVDYVVFLALGQHVDFFRAIAAQVVVVQIASSSPIPAELLAYRFFTEILPRETVASFIVIWRLLSYWGLIAIGAVMFALALREWATHQARRRQRSAPELSTKS